MKREEVRGRGGQERKLVEENGNLAISACVEEGGKERKGEKERDRERKKDKETTGTRVKVKNWITKFIMNHFCQIPHLVFI